MSIRSEYEKSARCKYMCRHGKQCSREATVWHQGRGFCTPHHSMMLKQAKEKKK